MAEEQNLNADETESAAGAEAASASGARAARKKAPRKKAPAARKKAPAEKTTAPRASSRKEAASAPSEAAFADDPAEVPSGDGPETPPEEVRAEPPPAEEPKPAGAEGSGAADEEPQGAPAPNPRPPRASRSGPSPLPPPEPAPASQSAPEPEPAPEPDRGPPAPERVDLNAFQQKPVTELYELGAELGLRVGGIRSKHQLIFEILSHWGRRGTKVEAEGILETTANDSYGLLRWPAFSFAPQPEDVYVSAGLIRRYGLQKGQRVRGIARPPREREKYVSMEEITAIEGLPAEEWKTPPPFDSLTALSPRDRIILENKETGSISARAVDLIAPLGKGQRGVIVAPPRGGKTILLKEIASSITRNHPEIEVIILLLDERPEEVTDFEEGVEASVYSSTFDESPERHVQLAELVAERAKRLVEIRKDVIILLDSLTRLARGYNGITKGRGGTMSGGLDSKALPKARKLFNIARNVEEGGSLTMLATALIDTGSRMDEVIFEEFKGSGNMEIQLDRELLEKRVFPAINLPKSGTRKDDLLYHPDELRRINMVRRQLAALPGGEAMEVLIRNIQLTDSNAALLLAGSLR